tara:strand:- start:510 stop:656 length:147 start_codon:yes stop_codon:yes gene_type:complete
VWGDFRVRWPILSLVIESVVALAVVLAFVAALGFASIDFSISIEAPPR